MARRCQILMAGNSDCNGIAPVGVAASFAMPNIPGAREAAPIAREIARLKRCNINIAGIVQVGKAESSMQTIVRSEVGVTKSCPPADRQPMLPIR